MQNFIRSGSKLAIVMLALGVTSACVTQNFAEDKPVVDRDYSDDQVARTRISLAFSYLKRGNMQQAKFNLEKAKEYSPNLVDVYTAFAHYYEAVGELEQTEEAYLHALSLDDQDANTLNNFGVFLCRNERVEEAEGYFMQAIRVPTYVRVSETYENIGLCYLKVDNFEKAEEAITRSIMHSPNRASSLMQMAQLQYAMGDYDASSMYLGRYELATRRFTPQAIALAFKVNQKMGNTEIANNYATMLLKMFPESVQSKAYLDNELAKIDADDVAIRYQKYKLLQSGVKVDAKPVVVARKKPPTVETVVPPQQQPKPQNVVQQEKPAVNATNGQQNSQNAVKQGHLVKQQKQTTTVVTPPPQQPQQNVKPAVVQTPVVQQNTQTNTQPTSTTISNNDIEHVVQKGENLYQISIKYNVMINTLRRWNNLKSEDIQVGQVLKIKKPD